MPYEPYEEHNDQHATHLASQIGILKDVSIAISTELDYQRTMMDGMEDDFGKTGGILSKTMRRLRIMAQKQSGSWVWIMMLFILTVILYVYFYRIK